MSIEQVIQLEKVNKWYDDFHVLKDIDLVVDKGQKIVICGPSGSGKSTMIRCINRLEAHQEGKIVVHGTELTNDLKNIDLIRKNVGMVFQQFNLFPHLTVLDNITLAPIWVKKMPKQEAEEIAMSYLEKVKIPEQAEKFPGQLSGGQQQRVALARAMVTQYGMTEAIGAIKLGSDDSAPFMGRDYGHQRDYSESVASVVDAEIRKLIEKAHQEAYDILEENRSVLDEMVLQLLEKETLNKEEIAEIFSKVASWPRRPAWTGSSTRLPSTKPPVDIPEKVVAADSAKKPRRVKKSTTSE